MTRNRQRMISLLLLMLTIQGSWSLALDRSQEEIRASIITKHNFQDHRQKKGLESAAVPAPFVVSTELKVNSQVRITFNTFKIWNALYRRIKIKPTFENEKI